MCYDKNMKNEFSGLTSFKAKTLLQEHGPNILPSKSPPGNFSLLLDQLKNPLVYVLVFAGLTTSALGEMSDTIIIFVAVFINTILGFVQEKRATKALYALNKLIHPEAKVIRDRKSQNISVENLVPGDLVILETGSKIPADGILVSANRFFVSEAILTGESVPVNKNLKDTVFMGTLVSAGRAEMIVGKTGSKTEIGKIALDVQIKDEATPLKKQLAVFSRQLTYMVLGLTLFVFVLGLILGLSIRELFTISVALAVSSIPEGLLVALTVILAIGIQRIAARKGLVRHLVSAETLGSVTTVCADKTGTLTEGKMKVTHITGDPEQIKLHTILANDLDDPMLITAWEWSQKTFSDSETLSKRYPRLDYIPFDSRERFFASLHSYHKKTNLALVNGAPDDLLSWSNTSASQKKKIENEIIKLTQQGMRVIGFAQKHTHGRKLTSELIKSNLTWIGFIAFSDPVRLTVKDAIKKIKKAGINIIIITGDYPQTAVAVLKKLDLTISSDNIILGSELNKFSEESLSKKLSSQSTFLFARTTPHQKLKIVHSLKKNNEVVAMMGDGVNDAPALKAADIGIVVGDSSDVAKETADLVLLDSDFNTIVAAIEEGRGLFDNLRKVILYLMCDAFEEIIAVIGSLLLSFPLPVSAVQILWINLVSDGFPNLALTIDSKADNIMSQKPRFIKENIVSNWMRVLIVLVSVSGGIFALSLFSYYYLTTGNTTLARSIAFAALGVNSLVYVYSVRTLKESFWQKNPFNNKWLNLAVLGGFIFQFLPFATSTTRRFFGLLPLNVEHLVIILGSAILMFIIIELSKVYFRLQKTH